MKKRMGLMLMLVSILLIACNNGYAEKQDVDDNRIVKVVDGWQNGNFNADIIAVDGIEYLVNDNGGIIELNDAETDKEEVIPLSDNIDYTLELGQNGITVNSAHGKKEVIPLDSLEEFIERDNL